MRRTVITLCTLLALASITIGVVWASSVHFKKGPTCVDNGLTATCTGTLAGLGNYDILAQLNTSGTGDSTCTNPGGNSKVPGQNPGLAVNPGGILIIPNSSVKNGTAPFTVTTVVPADPTPQAAGCPGNNWTASWANITFTGGTLNILQCVGGSINSAGFCVDSNGNDLGYNTALSTSVSIP